MKSIQGRLTILTDNTVPGRSDAIVEAGFSASLETNGGDFLFDTGKGKSVINNALIYKKDLKNINKIVLTHAHGDHTGGLPEVLRTINSEQIDVFAHPDIFIERFRKKNNEKRHGGIPFTKGYLEKLGARFVCNTEPVEIEEGVFLTGEVPRKTPFEGGDMGDRFLIRDRETGPDIILDDQSLIIHVEKGILIVLGCAHSGMINVIDHAINMTGVDNIYGIVGGTHIGFSGDKQLEETIEALRHYQIEHLVPAHCTGPEATFRLKAEFEKIFEFSHVGKSLDF